MTFLHSTSGRAPERTRLLEAAAGSDPPVLVEGPDGALLKKILPAAWASSSPEHPGGVLFPLSALSLVLGRMAVMPASGELATLPLAGWVDDPKTLHRLLHQAGGEWFRRR